jgi:glycosyltransferase involved in cell wall biosynthesis
MRILGMCLVRNEADIIRQCLRAAAEWCDAIYVFDNGSDDGAWDAVLDMSRKLRAVVPFKQDPQPFRDSLRGDIFERYKSHAREGDWWCRLDADEFYIDPPKPFLAAIAPEHGVVWSASFQYYFTERDAARYHRDPAAFGDGVPVEEKCRYYLNYWSEPRFLRHRTGLVWRDGAWPDGLHKSSERRIRLKHFQYRSPGQIAKRLATRSEAVRRGAFIHERFHNWKDEILRTKPIASRALDGSVPTDWEDRIVDSKALLFDDGSGNYAIDEAMLPPIRDLRVGRPLISAAGHPGRSPAANPRPRLGTPRDP